MPLAGVSLVWAVVPYCDGESPVNACCFFMHPHADLHNPLPLCK
jgi:hypothetical protein